MIALAKPVARQKKSPAWHKDFEAMLPRIRYRASIAFRQAKPEAKEELIAEVVANCFCAYGRLVARGLQDRAFVTPLVQFAVRHIRAGRRVGAKPGAKDVMSSHVRYAHGIVLERLAPWKDVLVEDRHAGPAETAAARIDFGFWIESLPRQKRRIAKKLARGESTGDVAKLFNVTPARVSQVRSELKQSWESFQGEPALC